MIHEYLNWNEKTISDFSESNVNSQYNEGYLFTRKGKGVMNQTRSLRIDLSKFKLSSENRRVLKKTKILQATSYKLQAFNYHWSIGKMAKDFYDTRFGRGVFTANKIKELMTDEQKSNFNTLFVYNKEGKNIGYAICYANPEIVHYSYPFYNLKLNSVVSSLSSLPPTRGESERGLINTGMGMMIMAIMAVKQNGMKYIYLGSAQRPTDIYKLQFAGLEWFDGNRWSTDISELKNILKISNL